MFDFNDQIVKLQPLLAEKGFALVEMPTFAEVKVKYPRFARISELMGDKEEDSNETIGITKPMQDMILAIESASTAEILYDNCIELIHVMMELSEVIIGEIMGEEGIKKFHEEARPRILIEFEDVIKPNLTKASIAIFA